MIDPMWMIRPQRFSRIAGVSARVRAIPAPRLSSTRRSQSSSWICSTGCGVLLPALLTRMSIRPKAACASRASRTASSRRDRSATIHATRVLGADRHRRRPSTRSPSGWRSRRRPRPRRTPGPSPCPSPCSRRLPGPRVPSGRTASRSSRHFLVVQVALPSTIVSPRRMGCETGRSDSFGSSPKAQSTRSRSRTYPS